MSFDLPKRGSGLHFSGAVRQLAEDAPRPAPPERRPLVRATPPPRRKTTDPYTAGTARTPALGSLVVLDDGPAEGAVAGLEAATEDIEVIPPEQIAEEIEPETGDLEQIEPETGDLEQIE